MRRIASGSRKEGGACGHQDEHRILDELAKIMPLGQPLVGAAYPALARQIGQSPYSMLTAKGSLERAGVLKATISNPPGLRGRLSTWELLLPVDQAHVALSAEHRRELAGGRGAEKPVRPKATARQRADDRRLIEQARRYRDRAERGLSVERSSEIPAEHLPGSPHRPAANRRSRRDLGSRTAGRPSRRTHLGF